MSADGADEVMGDDCTGSGCGEVIESRLDDEEFVRGLDNRWDLEDGICVECEFPIAELERDSR